MRSSVMIGIAAAIFAAPAVAQDNATAPANEMQATADPAMDPTMTNDATLAPGETMVAVPVEPVTTMPATDPAADPYATAAVDDDNGGFPWGLLGLLGLVGLIGRRKG